MKHRTVLIALIIAAGLLLAGCIGLGSTAEPTWDTVVPPPTETATATGIPPTATATPDPDVIPTPTEIVPPGPAPTPDPANKIANPNFTQGSTAQIEPDGTVIEGVPTDWIAYKRGLDIEWPEYYQEGNPQHIDADFAAWSLTAAWREIDGGLMQRFFDLTPGMTYVASCRAFAYAGDGVAGTPSSHVVTVRLGVSPTANEDPFSNRIIWGPEITPMLGAVTNVINDVYGPEDVYETISASFIAVQPEATLFIDAQSGYAWQRSAVTVDSCNMHATGALFQFYDNALALTGIGPEGAIGAFVVTYGQGMNLRSCPGVTCADVGDLVVGDTGYVYEVDDDHVSDVWLRISPALDEPQQWVAAVYGGETKVTYSLYKEN